MKALLAALALGLAASAVQAQSTAPAAGLESTATARTGWVKEPTALLHYGPDGTLDGETGLGRWEDSAGSRVNVHEIRAGASRSRRFAWIWDAQTSRDALRATLLESRRSLRFLGSDGLELWSDAAADRPDRGEPLVFSSDGETLILARRTAKGWTASIRDFTGSVLGELGPYPRLEAIALSDNGKYAFARWLVPDQSAAHAFYKISTKKSREIPSAEFYLGPARITDDGKVYTGKKLLFDFETWGSTTTISLPHAGALPSPSPTP